MTPPNPSNTCLSCLKQRIDITDGLSKNNSVDHCKECNRYVQGNGRWVEAGWETAELLTICLKNIRGMKSVKLLDAQFIWTEPHSKRIKVKLDIQKEIDKGTIL
jgi:nonsense-mediated mRNA decay protein 3